MVDFTEPRDLIPLLPAARDMLASETHRLHHAAWHDLRGRWSGLSKAKRDAILALGWQPGHGEPRPAVRNGAPIVENGSGEDFLYMHREMIGMVRAIYEQAGQPVIASWVQISPPGDTDSGFDVPPNWDQTDKVTQRRIAALKSDAYYWTAMRGWDRQFKNAAHLCTLSLGALGATLEYTVHNDMHMRWSSAPRDPDTGEIVPDGRLPTDFSGKWSKPEYDFLGEFYSSHVNPVFWRLHGWVDDRIEDWFAAHADAHPGEVERTTLNGVPWFKPGRWVTAQEPWSRPKPAHGHDHHGGHAGDGHDAGMDPKVLKRVVEILYAREAPAGIAAGEAVPSAPSAGPARATWFLT